MTGAGLISSGSVDPLDVCIFTVGGGRDAHSAERMHESAGNDHEGRRRSDTEEAELGTALGQERRHGAHSAIFRRTPTTIIELRRRSGLSRPYFLENSRTCRLCRAGSQPWLGVAYAVALLEMAACDRFPSGDFGFEPPPVRVDAGWEGGFSADRARD